MTLFAICGTDRIETDSLFFLLFLLLLLSLPGALLYPLPPGYMKQSHKSGQSVIMYDRIGKVSVFKDMIGGEMWNVFH